MVTKEEFYYGSADGISRIHAVVWKPEGEPLMAIQIVHGMQEFIDRYDEFARFLAEKGYLVCGEDHLGHGESVPEGGSYGFFCSREPERVIVDDTHRLSQLIRNSYGAIPIILFGHSFGSFITRDYLARFGKELKACILSGTGYMPENLRALASAICKVQRLFLGDKHEARMLNKMGFGSYLSRIDNPRTPQDWLSYNTESIDLYRADKRCMFCFTLNGFATLFALLKRVNDKRLMADIPHDLPIYMAAGKEDPVGGYGVDVEKLYHVYKDEIGLNVELKLYDGMRHELHNEPGRQAVYEDYLAWIRRYSND